MKLTMEKLKAMKAQWRANKPKLKACRKEVKQKELTGDDRWVLHRRVHGQGLTKDPGTGRSGMR